MGGGTSDSAMNANGQVAFNPTSIGGGNIAVGGSVGNGPVNQGATNQATGASVALDLSMPFPMLMNLQQTPVLYNNIDEAIKDRFSRLNHVDTSSMANAHYLQNLKTEIAEYEAKKGSQTMFDFNNGDPLKGTHVADMHKQAGASINFSGASGKQELGGIDQF